MKITSLPSLVFAAVWQNINTIFIAFLVFVLQVYPFQSNCQTAYWLESLNNNVKKLDVSSPPVAAAGATLLATPSIPLFIFQDKRNGLVYWSDAGTGSIKKVSTSGGVVTDVVTNISGAGIYPRGIYIDITNNLLYWAQTEPGVNDSIKKIDISGSLPKNANSGSPVVSGIDIVRGITLDTIANEIYYADAGAGGSGKAIYKAGSTAITAEAASTKMAVTGEQPNSLFIDRTNHFIYWSDFSAAGKIQRAATDAGAFPTSAVDVFTGTSVRGISIDLPTNNIYWTEFPSLKIRKASLSAIPVAGITDVVTGLLDLPRNLQVVTLCQPQSFYRDQDEDGYGDPQNETKACTQPAGYVSDNTDCNDANGAINPGATEICDGVDNNCNGTIDEGFLDSDGDGMADCVDRDDDNDGVSDASDCAPLDATKWRSADLYVDGDGDGYGAGNSVNLCYGANTPAGYSATGGDCNDGNAAINPGATEVCDGVDNNCNGSVDEGFADTDTDGMADCVDTDDDNDGVPDGSDCAPLDATKWRTGNFYIDGDGDGYGTGSSVSVCYGSNTPAGYSTTGGDCNDGNAAINPGATEICGNNTDDNCNGQVDENCAVCPLPANMSTTNITSSGATLNWSADFDPVEWFIQYKSYKKGPPSNWTNLTVAGNQRSVTIGSLLPNKDYSWNIRAVCANESTRWSSPNQFKTLPAGSSLQRDITISKALNLSGPGIGVYPNPSKGQFIVELRLEEKINAQANILVTDITGKVLQMDKATVSNGYLQKRMQTRSEMASGIYLVRAMVNGKSYVAKLLIDK